MLCACQETWAPVQTLLLRICTDSAATKFNLSSPENLLELIVAKECVVNLKGVGVAAGPTPESLSNIGAAVQVLAAFSLYFIRSLDLVRVTVASTQHARIGVFS